MSEGEGESTKVVERAGHQRMVPGSTEVNWISSVLMLDLATELLSF